MVNTTPPVLGFAAYSGTGKTTLLTQLLPLLKEKGLNVGLIKNSHHDVEMDQPGKDSFQLRKAGASPVLLATPYRQILIAESTDNTQPTLAEQLALLTQYALDLILVEGFRHEAFPKIELHRPSLNKPLLYPDDTGIIAVASDAPLSLPKGLVALDLNQPAQIAEFIWQHFFTQQAAASSCDNPRSGMLPVAQAQARLQKAVHSVSGVESVPLLQALGRITAQPVVSAIDIPPARNSAMDGYAFSSADWSQGVKFSLQQVGVSWAGKPFAGELKSGQCVRIFTGALVPPEADSVVMQEQVSVAGERIVFPAKTKPLQNIRAAGSDVQQGQELLRAAKKISPVDLALLASAGISDVAVRRRLKIAFFSTGDELCPLGQPLQPGQIYDSNRYALTGLLAHNAFDATDLGVIADDEQALERVFREAAQQFDVLISTGGASVGDADYVHQVLARCGQVDFWKLAIKPGKPLAFGQIGECLFFGLPGNPVAVMVTFEQIVLPVLWQLAGETPKPALQMNVPCVSRLKKKPGRQEYQRGILSYDAQGQWQVASVGEQDSHQLSGASRANCYIVLPAENTGVFPGQWVQVMLFGHG